MPLFGNLFSSSPPYSPLTRHGASSRLPSRKILVLAGCTVVALLLILAASFGPGRHPDVRSALHADQVQTPLGDTWSFDAGRDGLNYGLSDARCDAAFPGLFGELDRVQAFFSDKKINQSDVQIWTGEEDKETGIWDGHHHGQFHVLIHNGQLIVVDERVGTADRSRGLSTLASMYRAINAVPNPREIPSVEFVFDLQDVSDGGPPDKVRWSYCRHQSDQYVWVMPDFDGWSYPDDAVGSYVAFRENVEELEMHMPFEKKNPTLAWRGSTGVNRGLRMDLFKAAEGKSWSDVKEVNWKTRENVLSMQEFCNYQYNAHTEGNSWSGRLRYLQNCNSVSIVHDLEFVAHYYSLLEADGPSQNYVKVSRDFSDLNEKMSFLIANPENAKRIAAESVNVFRDRYLTPAAEACYWRRMISSYASVQAFEPSLYEQEVVDGVKKKIRRGQSFERYAFRQMGSHEHGLVDDTIEEESSSRETGSL